jgi:hypothetical protein
MYNNIFTSCIGMATHNAAIVCTGVAALASILFETVTAGREDQFKVWRYFSSSSFCFRTVALSACSRYRTRSGNVADTHL